MAEDGPPWSPARARARARRVLQSVYIIAAAPDRSIAIAGSASLCDLGFLLCLAALPTMTGPELRCAERAELIPDRLHLEIVSIDRNLAASVRPTTTGRHG